MPRTKTFSVDKALDKVTALFRRRGYHDISMQIIADHLGISRSSVYATYGGKHALFVSALHRYGPSCRGPGLKDLRCSSAPRAALIRVFELAIIDAGDSRPREQCLLINTAGEFMEPSPEIASVLQTAFRDLEGSFRHAIEHAQGRQEVAADVDPEHAARALLALYLGLQVLRRPGSHEQRLVVLQLVRSLLPAPLAATGQAPPSSPPRVHAGEGGED